MKNGFFITERSKKVTGLAVKVLIFLLIFLIGKSVSDNKFDNLFANIPINGIPYATKDIVLPGSNTSLDLSNPQSASNTVSQLLREIEMMMDLGIW